jgi:hypothetical protein
MINKFSRLVSTAPDSLTDTYDQHDYQNSDRLLSQPTIALLPFGDLIEDFLDTIGISFEVFCNEFLGSWMFGYVDALKLVGVRTVLFTALIGRFVVKPSMFLG